MNVIGLDGKPRVKGLVTLLQEWLVFRLITVKRRIQNRLDKILDRIHLLEGFIIAFLHIDEVIAIIREEDDPKTVLMARFGLTERQTEAILEIKLRQLAKLEEIRLRGELDELSKERDTLQGILADENRLKNLVKQEMVADRDKFGDTRRSPLIERQESQALKQEAVLANEPITVILSDKGWVRAAKGHDINGQELGYKASDAFKSQINARSTQQILFFDSEGKVYALPGHSLPSARGQGEPLSSRLNLSENANFEALITGEPEDWLLLSSDAGYGFVTQMQELFVKNRNGKACVKLLPNCKLMPPIIIRDKTVQHVACATNAGRLLVFPVADLPELTRGKGNKMLNIPAAKLATREEWIVAVQVLSPEDSLTVQAGRRQFTISPSDLSSYQGERGRRGNRLPRGLQNVTALIVVKPQTKS